MIAEVQALAVRCSPTRPLRRTLLGALAALALTQACTPLGVVGDGTTVSGGRANRGWLLDGRRLADEGEGFVTPAVWRTRGLRYGTDELVGLLTTTARSLAKDNAPVRLAIADLSHPGGGRASPHHRSHQSGRDVDLLLYLRDARGRATEATQMLGLGEDGVARDGSGHSLDAARTWRLVRALITSPVANVQHIFLYEPLSLVLLDHARAMGEPDWLVELARRTLFEPPGAPHDDHLHVRVYCSPADAAVGCTDFGNLDLLAKDSRARIPAGALPLRAVLAAALRSAVATSGVALAWRLRSTSGAGVGAGR